MAMFFTKGYAEVYSCPCGFVSFEGENSTITNRFRYSDQIITKFGNSSVFYNDVDELASLEEIIAYCKANWDGTIWTFEKTLLSFKQ